MSSYRTRLPQLDGGLFLTDGGIETCLIFHDGLDLPHFAAFDLLRRPDGRRALKAYYERYLKVAKEIGAAFVLESPTWRASADWARKLGYRDGELTAVNRNAIALMRELRQEHQLRNPNAAPIVVSGCVGPRGDGYDPGQVMTAQEAEAYHADQIDAFAQAGADMVCAITMTNVPEAIGIVRAARRFGLPVAISFTLETDGTLPTGSSLQMAIEQVDAATNKAPAYYMINCAHPAHFDPILSGAGGWLQRLRGLRANASKRSHQELNDAPDLDMGNPDELGREYRDLTRRHPQLNVLGGCCGTDHRHVAAIGFACRAERPSERRELAQARA
jgi:S-methylmethionine-dependent homocysteine/selenocysteine methylase